MLKAVILFLALFPLSQCDSQSEMQSDTVITYTEETRGSQYSIRFSGRTLQVESEGLNPSSTVRRLTRARASELHALASKLDVSALDGLPTDTAASAADRAAIAHLHVQTADGSHRTQAFDAGNPPAAISDFVNLLLEFAEKED